MSTSPFKSFADDDDDDFIPLAMQRTTRFRPQVITLAKPRSEDMRVVSDAEIEALPNNVMTIDGKRLVIRVA